jgi:hypothetical protein
MNVINITPDIEIVINRELQCMLAEIANYMEENRNNDIMGLIYIEQNIEDDFTKTKKKVLIREALKHLKGYKRIKKCDSIIGEECSICLEEFKGGQYKRELEECKHIFHKKCVDKWLAEEGMKCPLCRKDYSRDQN